MFKNKFAQLRQSRLARQGAAGVVALLASAGAMAQGTTIDVSGVVDTITSGVQTVTSLGVAVLSLVVVVKLFKWVKGAM